LYCKGDKLVLYCRDEFRQQMDFLRNEVMERGSFGWILGSPGTGKSTAAYAFLTSKLDEKKWKFTWMHFGLAQVQCVRFSDNKRENSILDYDDKASVQRYLHDGDDGKNHYLFLDGYVASGPTSVQIAVVFNVSVRWLEENRGAHRLCVVCSMPSRVRSKMDEDALFKIQEHYVSSWMLEEYRLAFGQKQVLECFVQNLDAGIKREGSTVEELMLSKLHFAGSCARYMFAFTTAEVINNVQSGIQSCHDIIPYVTSTVGEQATSAVNRLISNFVDREKRNKFVCSLVSRFVASELAFKQGPGMVKRIAETLRPAKNPVMEGFLLEMWFFALIGHQDLRLSPFWTFTKDTLVEFDPSEEIVIPEDDRLWYKPLKWNQGGYDAVHVNYKTRAITFVQVTISTKYSLKLGYFASLIHKLGIQPSSVEILFLVPRDVASGFKVSNVTGFGHLKGFVNLKGEEWTVHKESNMVQICTFAQDWNT
jgi:hypothetical protein